MSEEFKNKENDFITKFNDYVKQSDDFWLDPTTMAGATGTTENIVIQIVESSDNFVKNSKGKYTVRELYRKKTPLLKRFMDAYNSNID